MPDENATEQIQKRKPRPAVIALVSLIPLFILACFPPNYLRRSFCPDDTFLVGSIGDQTGLFGAVIFFLIIPAFTAVLMCLAPKQPEDGSFRVFVANGIKRAAAWSIPLALIIMLGGAFLWFNLASDFYCATPNALWLHSEPTGPLQRQEWQNVERVAVDCRRSRRRFRQYALNVDLKNGARVMLVLENNLGRSPDEARQIFALVRTSLQDTPFRYDFSDLPFCPPYLQQLLSDWRT